MILVRKDVINMYISFLGVILLGLQTLISSLSLLLVKEVTPYIPKFYRLFEVISTFEILDDAFLNKIWNNIYIRPNCLICCRRFVLNNN